MDFGAHHTSNMTAASPGDSMPTFVRYLLFQIPQWLLLGLFLWLLIDRSWLPVWTASGFLAVWLVKDLAFYPMVRSAYERNAKTGSEGLVGAKGVAYERLAPRGYIRVNGELWKAEAKPDDRPIPQGTVVRIAGAHGLTLIVEAEDKQGSSVASC
jgi:membrane protein implicated in regulation of membrane protease activity